MIKQLLVHNPFKWKEPMSYLAWAIRWRTGKDYNHTGLLVPIEGELYLIHAIFPKVQLIKFSTWTAMRSDRRIRIEEIEYDPKVSDVHTALEYVGWNYNWIGLLQTAYYITTGKWIGSTDNGHVYCYQLVEKWRGNKDAYKAIPRLRQSKG